jgi:hypothetical protein
VVVQITSDELAKVGYECETVSIEATDTLLSLAEIAVAVLGFAGVLAVMKGSQREVIPGINQWRLEALVVYGTNAIGFSLIPVLFLAMDSPDNTTWPIGSSVSAVVMIAWLVWAFRKQKNYFSSYFPKQTVLNDVLILIICVFSIVAAVDNVFAGGVFNQSFSGYLCSIAPWFYVAVMAFLRSILTIELGGESDSKSGEV